MKAEVTGAITKLTIRKAGNVIRLCLAMRSDIPANAQPPQNQRKQGKTILSGSGVVLFRDDQSKGIFPRIFKVNSKMN